MGASASKIAEVSKQSVFSKIIPKGKEGKVEGNGENGGEVECNKADKGNVNATGKGEGIQRSKPIWIPGREPERAGSQDDHQYNQPSEVQIAKAEFDAQRTKVEELEERYKQAECVLRREPNNHKAEDDSEMCIHALVKANKCLYDLQLRLIDAMDRAQEGV